MILKQASNYTIVWYEGWRLEPIITFCKVLHGMDDRLQMTQQQMYLHLWKALHDIQQLAHAVHMQSNQQLKPNALCNASLSISPFVSHIHFKPKPESSLSDVYSCS